MQAWQQGKADFKKALGGKLIYEYPTPVVFALSESAKKERLSEFCEWIASAFSLEDLADFLYENCEGFYQNKVISLLNSTPEEIKIGSKIIKDFKYYIHDKELCRRLQDKASMLIQEDKVTGTLCLSIHPLDYLSLSENTYNWRSCHALDGEYRAGNLSYMMDNTTVVCYLKGEDEAELPHFPAEVKWNSKKWRMLLQFSEDWSVIFAGRQYPFNSVNALDYVRDLLIYNGLKIKPVYSDWSNEYITKWPSTDDDLADRYACIRDRLFGIHNMVRNNEGSRQYNDLLYSSFYKKPYYLWSGQTPLKTIPTWFGSTYERVTSSLAPKFRVGADTKCICCGTTTIDLEDSMVCEDCRNNMPEMHFCAHCGNEIDLSKDKYFIDDWDGQYYCAECAAKVIKECPKCGRLMAERYMKDDLCCICYIRENRPRPVNEPDYSQIRILPLTENGMGRSNIGLQVFPVDEDGTIRTDLGFARIEDFDGITFTTAD